MQDLNDNMFEISAKGGISVTQMNRFLGVADDVDAMAPVNLNTFSTLHMMKQPGRFDELDLSDDSIDDVILCGICSDDNNVFLKGALQKASVDDVIAKISMLKFANHIKVSNNIFESALSRCDVLQLARRTFYEGQVRGTVIMRIQCVVIDPISSFISPLH